MKLKIYLSDNPQYKTTKVLKKHWETDDRFELVVDPYFNPIKAKWADVTWIEWCEGSMQEASRREGKFEGMYDDFTDPGHTTPINWSGDWRNTRLINRCIDIEAYWGHYRGVTWGNVDDIVFIAKHIQNMVMNDGTMLDRHPNLRVSHIPLSIETSSLTFKDRSQNHGKNIAFVNHLWAGKNIPLALLAMKEIVKRDNEFKLHIVGDWSSEHWLSPYVRHLIKELKLEDNVHIYPRVPSINDFLDTMDYSLSTSSKEAFSLITGESMAKGLKPLIHNWEGAKDIWSPDHVWTTIDDLLTLLFDTSFESERYRSEVEQYDSKYEIERADNLILG